MIQIQLQHSDPQAMSEVSSAGSRPARFEPFGEDGLTFGDLLDIVNPLQHIPLLGAVYRKLTGDSIDPAIRVAGGALFGGALGAIVAAAAVAVGEARRPGPASVQEIEPQVAQRPARGGGAVSATVRGGWIVAAARGESVKGSPTPVHTEAAKLSLHTGPEIRRGGWIVAQAYGVPASSPPDDRSNQTAAMIDLAV